MAMPITVQPDHETRYGDAEHWRHVMETLLEPAIRAAGFTPIPPVAQGADMIHGGIIKNLSTADLVIVDLSSHNPNVFFELGVRTSLNLPVALIADEHTKLPFDTSGINTHKYDSQLRGWEVAAQVAAITKHVEASWKTCDGANPLWQYFGLTLKASEPSSTEDPLSARVDLLADGMAQLQETVLDSMVNQERMLAEQRQLASIRDRNSEQTRFRSLSSRNAPESNASGQSVQTFLRRASEALNGTEVRVHSTSNGTVTRILFDRSGMSPSGATQAVSILSDLAAAHGIDAEVVWTTRNRKRGHDGEVDSENDV